jgi:hypothetical protein
MCEFIANIILPHFQKMIWLCLWNNLNAVPHLVNQYLLWKADANDLKVNQMLETTIWFCPDLPESNPTLTLYIYFLPSNPVSLHIICP